ncbi:hypothetical protein SprV_0702405400 [Sparganum proliferum]
MNLDAKPSTWLSAELFRGIFGLERPTVSRPLRLPAKQMGDERTFLLDSLDAMLSELLHYVRGQLLAFEKETQPVTPVSSPPSTLLRSPRVAIASPPPNRPIALKSRSNESASYSPTISTQTPASSCPICLRSAYSPSTRYDSSTKDCSCLAASSAVENASPLSTTGTGRCSCFHSRSLAISNQRSQPGRVAKGDSSSGVGSFCRHRHCSHRQSSEGQCSCPSIHLSSCSCPYTASE